MDRELTFRRARPSEATAVRELIVRSMAHWDRPPAYLDEARSLMSLSGEDIERDEAWVLADGTRIVGFLRVSASGTMLRSRSFTSSRRGSVAGSVGDSSSVPSRRRGRWELIGSSGRPISTRWASTLRGRDRDRLTRPGSPEMSLSP